LTREDKAERIKAHIAEAIWHATAWEQSGKQTEQPERKRVQGWVNLTRISHR
jgi:hypothetical protein